MRELFEEWYRKEIRDDSILPTILERDSNDEYGFKVIQRQWEAFQAGAASQVGEWTKTLPTEPGWYWQRNSPGGYKYFRYVTFIDGVGHVADYGSTLSDTHGEWSSQPVPSPKEDLKNS